MNSSHLEQLFLQLGQKTVEWAVTSGISILGILVVTLVALRAYRMLARRIEKTMVEKSAVHPDRKDPEEVRKRINTLSGILRTVGTVAAWRWFCRIRLTACPQCP